MNLFDILGPIMVGPSSSHTAGAVRMGNMAEVGRSLPHTLRETGKGGLAATPFAQQYAPKEI